MAYSALTWSFSQRFAFGVSQQRWVPHRMRRSVIKRLAPDVLRDYSFKQSMDGGAIFSGNLKNHIDLMVYFCGAHEKYMLYFLRDALKDLSQNAREEVVFLDVGANVGNHVLYMAPLVKQVYAFEPFERVRVQLESNVTLNGFSNVDVLPFGLSDKEGCLPFYAGTEKNLGTSSFDQGHCDSNKLIGEGQVIVGDDFINDNQINKTHIIKVDVEGFEAQVLCGLKQTVKRDYPLIVLELSLTTRNKLGDEDGFRALFPEGYRFYYFSKGKSDSGKYELSPFTYDLMPKLQDVIAVPPSFDLDKFL